MEAVLPILVARSADRRMRGYLGAMALTNDVALVDLVDPPINGTLHILEAHLSDGAAPLVLLAEPQGAPTAAGFPLRLRPLDAEQEHQLRAEHAAMDDDAMDATLETRPSQLPSLGHPDDTLEPTEKFEAEAAGVDNARTDRPPRMSAVHEADLSGIHALDDDDRDDAEALIGKSIAAGKYTIGELLGAGGSGRVYKARHRELRKNIAVKVLHPSFQRDLDFCTRFYGEALAASQLDHPNVLRVLDFGQEPDGLLYIAMEFLDGRDLQSIIAAEGAQPVARIVAIMMQVCGALTAAHERGIVHRDIKPENIVIVQGIDDDGKEKESVKVCDFGMAQRGVMNEDETVMGTSPSRQEIAGTPSYMSPEQARGETLDERSDIYSCGITLYELATGRVPFDGETPVHTLLMHFEDAPQPPSELRSDLHPLLEQIILRALCKDPAARQQTARQLRAELREVLTQAAPRVPSDFPGAIVKPKRELRDAASLMPLDAPGSRFADLFVSLTAGVSRSAPYDRTQGPARLARTADVTLAHRGELTFARYDVGEDVQFSVATGLGEVHELKKLLPTAIAPMQIAKFATAFVKRNMVALVLEDGIDARQFGDLIDLLASDEVSGTTLRKELVARRLSHTKLVFASDLLGLSRGLPWQVDLCIARIARDLRTLPSIEEAGIERVTQLRAQLISDVMRTLPRTEHIKRVLENAELIERVIAPLPEFSGFRALDALVASLPRARCLQIANLTLADLGQNERSQRANQSIEVAPRSISLGVITALAARFSLDRSVESDEMLTALQRLAFVALEALPHDLQTAIRSEKQADVWIQHGDASALSSFDERADVPRFAVEMLTLERSMRTLARRGEAGALWTIVSRLKQIARDAAPGDQTREALAARTLRVLEDPAVLTPIAEIWLRGDQRTRDAAGALLVHAGVVGAHAVYAARARVGMNGDARARFVTVLREIGRSAWPALFAAIDRAQPSQTGAFDPELAEDLLRAIPEVHDEHAGTIVARFVLPGAPAVCRAALAALAVLWGVRAKPLLVGALDMNDDSIRVAAITALVRIRGVDENVIERFDKFLARNVPGDDVRSAIAMAIPSATMPARAVAVALLKKMIAPPSRSVLSLFRSGKEAEETPAVLASVARAIVQTNEPTLLEALRERIARADEPLKSELAAIAKF